MLGQWARALAFVWCAVAAEKDRFAPLRKEGSPRERELVEELRQWTGHAFKVTRRVVGAMTTTPARIRFIEPAIDSLLNQSRALDVLYLFVPMIFLREGTEYEIPEWLQRKASSSQSFQLRRCFDSGPATHMHQVLKVETNPNTYILQVDDDQIYGHRLLEKLLTTTGPVPGRAIGAATQHAYNYLHGPVLEGVHGVLFQRKFFDRWASNYEGFPDSCRMHDDLWFSANLARKGLRRESLFSRFGSTALKFGFEKDALFRGGAGTSNQWNFLSCMAALLKAQPKLWSSKDRVAVLAPLSAGASQPVSTKGLRRAMALQRGNGGPDAVYWFGPVGQEQLQHLKHRYGSDMAIPGGLATTMGATWNSSMEVYLRDCTSGGGGGACSYSDALHFLLSLEDDPLTILVVYPEPINQRQLSSLGEHLRCVQQQTSHFPCHGRGGSVSFRRHAASKWEDVGKVVFMPHFSTDFHKPAATKPSGDRAAELEMLRESAAYFQSFHVALGFSPETQRVVNVWLAEMRRTVALLWPRQHRAAGVAAAVRGLMRQRQGQRLRRVYVHLGRRCVVGSIAHWHRVTVLCGQEPPLLQLLKRECRDDTVVLLWETAPRRQLRFEDLLQALHLWSGQAVAERVAADDLLPHLQWGLLIKRSFLDLRIFDDWKDWKKRTRCTANLLAHHFHQKAVGWKVLGNRLAPASGCAPLAAALPPRCVLLVRLQRMAEEMLELTLRLAAAQTRKPEEVIFVASSDFFDVPRSVQKPERFDSALLEVHLEGGVAGDLAVTAQGRRLQMSLMQLLRAVAGKVGVVVRERMRSFVLSVVTCSDLGLCGPRSMLAAGFAREWEPATILMFSAVERLVNERYVEDNEDCIANCGTSFDQKTWCGCGQNLPHKDGSLYDMTIRRASGYLLQH